MSKYCSKEFSSIVDKILKADSKNLSEQEQDLKDNIKLIISIAKNYIRSKVELEDLIMVGVVAMLEARNNFDPTRSQNFKAYSTMCALGSMFTYCQKNSKLPYVQTYINKASVYIEKIYKHINASGSDKITREDTENIILNYRCKKVELLPEQVQEKISYEKERIYKIAYNSSLKYEDLAKLALASLITVEPDSVLENHSDTVYSVEDIVACKEIQENLKRTLPRKVYRTLELSVQGYNNPEIAQFLFEEGLTKKSSPVSRAAIKNIKDVALKAIKNMILFSKESS